MLLAAFIVEKGLMSSGLFNQRQVNESCLFLGRECGRNFECVKCYPGIALSVLGQKDQSCLISD